MNLELTGKTCLVTGASSGIGAAVARMLASEGVLISLVARRIEQLKTVAQEIVGAGSTQPNLIIGDLSRAAGVQQVAAQAIGKMGRVDILVNCAGGSRPLVAGENEAIWEEAFSLNFHAARQLTEAVLPEMRTRGWGRIINISGSMEPRSANAATAAKAALHLWSKGLSCEVAADGITINCIPPGRINSEQILTKLYPTEQSRLEFIRSNIPAGYFGEPEDVANLVAFLASPRARYITGAVLPVDGGMHFFAH